MVDRARERAARLVNVIKLEIAPKALQPSAQHDPAELKPSASSAANGSGFKRRF